MMKPKITIITVSHNSAPLIEETIKSVISQNYENLEYIIIDGASTDNTLSIIEQYSEHISKIISEPDQGISDAFNKGIRIASGEIIGIINSDDILMPGAVEAIALSYENGIDIYRGNELIWNPNSEQCFREIPSMHFSNTPLFTHFCHEASFITKSAYQRWGGYDLRLHYAMDPDLFIRFYQNGAKMKYVNYDIMRFRIGGTTSLPMKKKKNDYILFSRKNGASWGKAHLYYLCLVAMDIAKKVLDRVGGPDFKKKLRYAVRKN